MTDTKPKGIGGVSHNFLVVDDAVARSIHLLTRLERSVNKAHPNAPKHIREMEVPTATPVGHMRSGPPPSGLVLCLQAGDDVWRWWHISSATAGYREAWCLESDQGGALGMARICNWLDPDAEKKNADR